MSETWRPVPGWVGFYEVSDLGQVRSVPRIDSGGNRRRGLVRRAAPDRKGYLRVQLHRSGSRKSAKVHRLVLEAFVGPCPPDMEGCHGDGDPANNSLINLRWDTASANTFDSVRLGVHPQASKRACPSGHPYSPENTYVYASPRGWTARACRVCKRAQHNRYKARQRAQRSIA